MRARKCVRFGKETADREGRTHTRERDVSDEQMEGREGGEREKEREGEVANIWGSSGRATRALIELYKSLILHPHSLHPAPSLP